MTRGTALDTGVRSGRSAKGNPYSVAWLNVLDATLGSRGVVEVTRFLKDGEPSPFADVSKGDEVQYELRSLDVFRGVVSGELASTPVAPATAS